MPIVLGNDTITGLGVGGLPNGTVNADDLASGAVTRAKMGYAGAVLQVASFHKTNTYVASGGFSDPGLDVTITPTLTSSKILVMVTCCMSTVATTHGFILRRNGTNIALADSNGGSTRTTVISSVGNNVWQNQLGINFLDSPSSTSALTYDIVIQSHDGREVRMNRSGSIGGGNLDDSVATSTITVMEIAG
jgi:hypothetical protein